MVIFGVFILKGKSATTNKDGVTKYRVTAKDEFGNKIVLDVTKGEYENFEVDGLQAVNLRRYLAQSKLDEKPLEQKPLIDLDHDAVDEKRGKKEAEK
jgi:hypothetical protein